MHRNLALVISSLLFSCWASGVFADEKVRPIDLVKGDYVPPGISAAEVLRARGYLAKEFFFYTRDGYKINLVRGRNPLINRGKSALAGTLPILFVHGTVDSAPTMLSASTQAKPKNFSRYLKRLHKIQSANKLIELLNEDHSIHCLPFLALNFGYEIWLVNRRGYNRSKGRRGHENRTLTDAILSIPATMLGRGIYPEWFSKERPNLHNDDHKLEAEVESVEVVAAERNTTQEREKHKQMGFGFWKDLFSEHMTLLNLPKALTNFGKFKEQFIQTFDPEYWDFSLDEQAKYDVTEAIELIVERTGCGRVHTVGISSGGALLLLAPAEKPELSNKIASSILWAPSLNMGSAKDLLNELSNVAGVFQSFTGPFPFVFSQQPMSGLIQDLCKTQYMQRNLCSRLFDLIFGYSDRQAPFAVAPIANIMEPTSFGELAHLSQFSHTTKPCKFKFNNKEKNIERYGQEEPPCYDLSKVKVEHISIYSGMEDILVSPGDINVTCSQLSVPVKLELFGSDKIFMNHVGAILHDHRGRLIQVPSFLDIRRAELSSRNAKVAAKCHALKRRPVEIVDGQDENSIWGYEQAT